MEGSRNTSDCSSTGGFILDDEQGPPFTVIFIHDRDDA